MTTMTTTTDRKEFNLAVAHLAATNNATRGDMGTEYWDRRTASEAWAVLRTYVHLADPTPEEQLAAVIAWETMEHCEGRLAELHEDDVAAV